MLEAKDFWHELCEEFDYRFFSGIPFLAAEELYINMNAKMMHYVPAANEHIALKLASGAWTAGFKSAVILPARLVNNLNFEFNINFGIPVLVLTTKDELSSDKRKFIKTDLYKAKDYIEKTRGVGIFLLD